MEAEKLAGRLIIDKVILRNFKSYAGEKVIGPFHKNLTSVVGPNGSGKSNLLESLLFAFGKRARKMRLKKLSELIHHSQTFPNLSEASVEVHFENIIDTESGFETVPNSSTVLCRTVKKNSTSEYRLNGKVSTYEEVTSLLRMRGIDLEHNRFLILQGEVEQIAMMKPKAPPGDDSKSGLLEYLEEIIGTDKYVNDIEKAEKELEVLGDDVAGKKLRFEESKKILDQLEGPMKEAVAYIELEKESYSFKCLKLKIEKYAKIKQGENIKSELESQDKILKDIEAMFNEKKRENEGTINEYEEKRHEIEQIESDLKRKSDELQEVMAKDTHYIEEIKKVKRSIAQGQTDKETNLKRCKEIKSTIEKLEEQNPLKDETLQKLKKEREAKEQEFQVKNAEVQSITENLQREKENLNKELDPLKRESNKVKAEKNNKSQDIKTLSQEIENSEKEKQETSAAINDLTEQLAHKTREFGEIQETLDKRAGSLTSKTKKLDEIKEDLRENNSKLRELQQKLSNHEAEEQKMMRSKGVFTEILKAKMEKKLLGVEGRLGDLGQIDAKYDVAVSSAFSGPLDNIVVDTVQHANDVIQFVRDKSLGKVTVIILEKIRVDRRNMEKFVAPEKSIRLFDQIRLSNERFKDVFYSIFQNTLFTDNIDDARRIALGEVRHKVTTKNGDIINPSGEMRGFSQPLRGKMSLVGDRKESLGAESIENVKKEIRVYSEAIEKLNKEKYAVEAEIDKEKKEERELRQQKDFLKNEVSEIGGKVKAKQERLKIISARSIEDMHGQIQKLQSLVDQAESNIAKLDRLLDQKNKQMAVIDGKIEDTAGPEYKRLKAELQSLVQEEEKTEKELSKNCARLVQSKKDLEKYLKQQEKTEHELVEFDAKYNELVSLKTQNAERAEKLIHDINVTDARKAEFTSTIEVLLKKKDELKKEFDEIIKSRNEVKLKKKELLLSLEDIEKTVSRYITKLESFTEEYNSIKNEYSVLLSGMEVEQISQANFDHQSKKLKLLEERISLRRPVDWEGSNDEYAELLPKLKSLDEIEKVIEGELASAQPNLKVINDYKQRLEDKEAKEKTLAEAKSSETEMKTQYTDLKNRRLNEFKKGFEEITGKLREMYRLLTRGGDAELEFADTTDPFNEGIVFTVRPPSKSWKKMANLSGGEKTLSSLALVFALHHYKPNSLYVMDEVDAALDFQNVSVIASYIKGQTKNAQFIVVSLRYQMFEVADQLVGVYKTNDVSQSLCICPFALGKLNSNNQIIRQTLDNISLKE